MEYGEGEAKWLQKNMTRWSSGEGHDGLITTAYLVKAGVDVRVLERRDKVAGDVTIRALARPGFKHDSTNA